MEIEGAIQKVMIGDFLNIFLLPLHQRLLAESWHVSNTKLLMEVSHG